MTPWTVTLQVPLSMGFSRQEYLSGLPSSIPGDLPEPGIELAFPTSPVLATRFFATEPPGKLVIWEYYPSNGITVTLNKAK